MSMVNADSVQLFAMLKKMQDSISSIETTKKSVKMKYEQLGAGWQDKKYNELGVVVRDCNVSPERICCPASYWRFGWASCYFAAERN